MLRIFSLWAAISSTQMPVNRSIMRCCRSFMIGLRRLSARKTMHGKDHSALICRSVEDQTGPKAPFCVPRAPLTPRLPRCVLFTLAAACWSAEGHCTGAGRGCIRAEWSGTQNFKCCGRCATLGVSLSQLASHCVKKTGTGLNGHLNKQCMVMANDK